MPRHTNTPVKHPVYDSFLLTCFLLSNAKPDTKTDFIQSTMTSADEREWGLPYIV